MLLPVLPRNRYVNKFLHRYHLPVVSTCTYYVATVVRIYVAGSTSVDLLVGLYFKDENMVSRLARRRPADAKTLRLSTASILSIFIPCMGLPSGRLGVKLMFP